jgi:hypothetical protein
LRSPYRTASRFHTEAIDPDEEDQPARYHLSQEYSVDPLEITFAREFVRDAPEDVIAEAARPAWSRMPTNRCARARFSFRGAS